MVDYFARTSNQATHVYLQASYGIHVGRQWNQLHAQNSRKCSNDKEDGVFRVDRGLMTA